VGDVVVGVVTALLDAGLILTLVAVESGVARDIEQLKITVCSPCCICWLLVIALSSNTHTHPFNGPLSRTTRVSQYQKGNTNLDFTEARDSEWQWHQLGRMQVSTSLQADNHANTSPLSFLQARCPSCHPTNSVKALKA